MQALGKPALLCLFRFRYGHATLNGLAHGLLGEGSEYSPDETGRIDMRVIGTDTTLSVHAVQLDPSLPPSQVLWTEALTENSGT